MDIAFTVHLPVDTGSIPFIRGLCRQALVHLRIERAVIDEIALALTEACANVVQHGGDQAQYEVEVAIDDRLCRISVVDNGEGFDPATLPQQDERSPLDGGRGLLLMQALVDRLDFRHEPDGRHLVTLEKRLGPHPPLRLVDPV
ncbi:ATP-binding protein [Geodermatophilus chilensis]|uniref:ATP-binding protein n=1 Tax=Geodermatophilus chilensis TaxID=2035835 RepID=UPI0012FFE3A2|nr:ATP-binding protein [Geodermatophilus chilensis]